MPFRHESFDAVVCCFLFELLAKDDIQSTLLEISRVLRPGGTFSLALIGQNDEMFNRAYRVASSLVRAFWGRQVEQEIPDMISATGLIIEQDRFLRQTFYPSRVLVARKAPIA
jgi:ubiquinone/menaquinone biosynthesis C-methylase UbiE